MDPALWWPIPAESVVSLRFRKTCRSRKLGVRTEWCGGVRFLSPSFTKGHNPCSVLASRGSAGSRANYSPVRFQALVGLAREPVRVSSPGQSLPVLPHGVLKFAIGYLEVMYGGEPSTHFLEGTIADRAPSYGPCGQGLDKCSALSHPFPTLGALAPTSSPPQQQTFMTKATSSRLEAARIAPPSQENRLRNNPAKSRGDPTRQRGKQQTVRSGGIVTELRDLHRLPTGAWAIHSRAPVDRPWKSLRVRFRRQYPRETIPGGTEVADSCEEEVKSMARQVGPACHEPEPALGPFEAVWEMRRGVRGFHQGPGTDVPSTEAGYKCGTEPACPNNLSLAIAGRTIQARASCPRRRWGPLGAGWKPALRGSRALEKPALPGTIGPWMRLARNQELHWRETGEGGQWRGCDEPPSGRKEVLPGSGERRCRWHGRGHVIGYGAMRGKVGGMTDDVLPVRGWKCGSFTETGDLAVLIGTEKRCFV